MSENQTQNQSIKPTEAVEVVEADNRNDASIMKMATIIAESRDFPQCRTPQKAAVRIMAGRELGIGPIASMDGVRIEDGKICTSAAVMESIIDRSQIYDWKLIERNANHCAIEFFRNGESRGTIDYTIENARTAGLFAKKGDNWKKHPEAMLFAAAFRTGARAFCAGAFNGQAVYTYDELGVATDADGNAIDNGEDSESSESTAGELCTREQRQSIRSLARQAGIPEADLLAESGVSMLDEFSAWEAAKLIRKLENRISRQQPPTDQPADQQPEFTPAQQMLGEAFDESRQPSTPEQREKILNLAAAIEPDENQRYEMLLTVLQKRSCAKIAQLNSLQAAALIESMQKMADRGGENKPAPFARTN